MLYDTLNPYIVIYLFLKDFPLLRLSVFVLWLTSFACLYFFLPIPSLLPRFSHSTEQRNSLLHPIPFSHSILGLCRPYIYGTRIHAVFYGLYCTVICRSHWPRGLWPLACWGCGIESHRAHGCLIVVIVRQRSLQRADHSSRGVLPTMVRRRV